MEKISNYQLFGMIFLFQLGTTIIFGFGSSAGRDAWIAIIISSILGTLITMMYVGIMKLNPGLTLVQWYTKQFGWWLGAPIAWLYPLIFLFDAGRIVSDVKDLVTITLLPTTPPIIFISLFLMVILYALFLGIENLARGGELLVPIILFLFLIEIILLLYSNIVHFKYLSPFLEHGWGVIRKTIYPQGIAQTYGESIIFAMIWTQAKNPKHVMKITIFASLASGIVLSIAVILGIASFGEDLYSRSIYPLFSLLGIVNVAQFINNLDPFGVIYLTTMAFFKMYIKIYASLKAIEQLTFMKNYRVLIVPTVLLVLYLGMTMSENISEHIYGMAIQVVTPYIWVPLFFIFPLLLFVVSFIRVTLQKLEKNKNKL